MRALDPILFLVGHRGAIERSAASRWMLVVGALLVVTAGIARNYDHLDLLDQWEWLYGPFLASLVSTVFIYIVCKKFLEPHFDPDRSHTDIIRVPFLPFLTLFWLTAPCAWVYAIPVELWGDLLFATKWNLAFLGIVSLWRVALIVRALRVLTGTPTSLILLCVLLPASIEAAIASVFKGVSLVGIMGGVRLPPHHIYLREATSSMSQIAIWLAVASAVILFFEARRKRHPIPFPNWGWGSFFPVVTALVAILVWVGIALPFQGRVRNTRQLERLIDAENYKAAIAWATGLGAGEFSQIHFLPPRPFAWNRREDLVALLGEIDETTPPWLRAEWAENFALSLTVLNGRYLFESDRISPEKFSLLESIPEVRSSIRKHADEILSPFPPEGERNEEMREFCDAIKRLAGESDG